MYLLDTNIISALSKSQKDEEILDWLNAQPKHRLFASAISFGEMRYGICLLPMGKRRQDLELWIAQNLDQWFGTRILPIERATAEMWGKLRTEISYDIATTDGLIAATAMAYDLTLVTKNTRDFKIKGLRVMAPGKR